MNQNRPENYNIVYSLIKNVIKKWVIPVIQNNHEPLSSMKLTYFALLCLIFVVPG